MALRTSLPVQPHLYIGDSTGRPLDYGMVYFGQPNKDPEFYPIDTYYDKDLSRAAAQPVRTKGGFLNANGDMTEIYASDYTYSVKVLDEHGVLVFYEPNMERVNISQDSQISTKLPYPDAIVRTQGDRNQDSVTVQDFGGKGDMLNDDTLSFEYLETYIKGRNIDLQGKSYKVNKAPTKNIYSNGKWFIGGQLIPVNGELITSIAKQFDIKAAAKDSAASIYRMFKGAGRGGNRTMQSAAQDSSGNLYTNHNTQIDDNTATVSVVNKYSSNSSIVTASTDFTSPEDRIGHQGLTVLYRPKLNDYVFITSSPDVASGIQNHPDFDYTVGGGYGVVLFKFKSNIGGDIDRPVQYRVLQANTISTSSTTPTITSDGKWLIIKYSGNGQNGRQYFRVFSTELLNSLSDTDISSKYTHEFSFVVSELLSAGDTIHSLSGFCSDGNHLYAVLAGYRDPVTQPKYLLSCDLLGNDIELAKSNIFETSVQPDSGIAPTFIETEGMLIVEIEGVKYLGAVVVSDTPIHSTTSRFSAIYLLGAKKERQAVNSSSIKIYEDDSNPSNPINLKVSKYTLNGAEQDAGLIIDNNGRGSNNLLSLQRNGATTVKIYSSTENVAITAPSGNHRLILGATKNDAVDGTAEWNWLIDNADGYFKPYGDNKYSIGAASARVAQIYAANGSINTSDERLKTQMVSVNAAEKRAAMKIKAIIKRYKFTDMVEQKGDSARYHFGIGAQTVGQIMRDEGLIPEKYAFYCVDEWPTTNDIEAGSRYGIRYDELAMFILAAI